MENYKKCFQIAENDIMIQNIKFIYMYVKLYDTLLCDITWLVYLTNGNEKEQKTSQQQLKMKSTLCF